MKKITDSDVKRALAMLALEGEQTLLDADAPDVSALLVAFLRDHLQVAANNRALHAVNAERPPRLATADTWEPFPDGWTIVNRTAMRHAGRLDAKTSAPALPGVSYLPASFRGEYFGSDLRDEIARGDVQLYPPGVAVPKAALKLSPAVWNQRSQLAATAKHARECANALAKTQYYVSATTRAEQLEANEARRAKAAAAPKTTAVNSFTAGKNPLTAPAEPLPPGAVRNSFGVIQPKA